MITYYANVILALSNAKFDYGGRGLKSEKKWLRNMWTLSNILDIIEKYWYLALSNGPIKHQNHDFSSNWIIISALSD